MQGAIWTYNYVGGTRILAAQTIKAKTITKNNYF